MPINTPVPIYATSTSEGNSSLAEPVRRLTGTSPGTTDNTATTLSAPSLLAVSRGYMVGLQSAHTSAYSGAGVYRNMGWCFTPAQAVVSGFIASVNDGYKIQAGTWTIPVHYSRPGGLLTGNPSITLRLNLYRVSGYAASTSLQHIGEGQASFSVTTSEASTNVTVSGAQATFEPGECIFMEIWMEAAAGVGDITRLHTNSTTGLRISAAPQYSKIPTTVGSTTATASVAGATQQVIGAVGSVSSSAAVSGIAAQTQLVVGSSVAAASVVGETATVLPAVGSVAAAAAVSGVSAQVQSVRGNAQGLANVAAVAANVHGVVGSVAGAAVASASGGVVVGTVGSVNSAATVDGRVSKVIGTVGSVTVGGGATVVRRKKVVIYDRC